ncbi:hypothetical protein KAR91_83540 [Candidatus Pacearchaeota archaeon]|nr:hypothetical protein [Candidatus Pacearchaeota archaeon]
MALKSYQSGKSGGTYSPTPVGGPEGVSSPSAYKTDYLNAQMSTLNQSGKSVQEVESQVYDWLSANKDRVSREQAEEVLGTGAAKYGGQLDQIYTTGGQGGGGGPPSPSPSPTPPAPRFSPTPVSTGLTPDETVEGRLSGIMATDSPLMRLADTYGIQSANKRGLADSGLSGEYGMKAMLEKAIPIASQDAGAMQAQKQGIMGGDIQKNLYETQAGLSSELSEQEATQNLRRDKQATADRLALETYVQDSANQRLASENTMKSELANLEITNREREIIAAGITDLGRIVNEQTANIQRDTTLNVEAKTAALENIQSAHRASLNSLASVYGVPIDWIIDTGPEEMSEEMSEGGPEGVPEGGPGKFPREVPDYVKQMVGVVDR